jgi:tRNA U38,U39,U40 pseudouridine synthase TruA
MNGSENKMLDCTKVRTFTPIIPAGTGPTCTKIEDALLEITRDLYGMNEFMNFDHSDEEAEKLAHLFKKVLFEDHEEWIDGEYPVVGEGYLLKIETMQQWQLDKMPEFNGY